jgi:diguanylate cyclase
MWAESLQVSDEKTGFLSAEWLAICEEAPGDIREFVFQLVENVGPRVAETLLAALLKDEEAAPYLTHEIAVQHLRASLTDWLTRVFRLIPEHCAQDKVTHQYQVGAIHARLKIPLHLIAKGGRILKGELASYLLHSDLNRKRLVQATRYMGDVLDHALEVMEEAYLGGFEQQTRNDEAFRLFSVGQNIAVERERQRATLMEWFSAFMVSLHDAGAGLKTPRLGMSEFGLWFRHKALGLFQDNGEIKEILRLVNEVDEVLVERIALLGGDSSGAGETLALIRRVDESVNQIRYLSNWIFDQYLDIEHGLDPLTRLLNRRFLPSVLGREVSISLKTGKRFAVLILDIDRFKQINDTFGHKAGDAALQEVAEIAKSGVRSSDFVFRYGGEEFLVLLVEIEPDQARRVAEFIRRKVEEAPFQVGDLKLNMTVSIGIALHDGHPDYEYVMSNADQALYRAKSKGRNRCEMHADSASGVDVSGA